MPKKNARRSVLIIDDDPAVLALLRRLLVEKYLVYTACDGREAVDACIAAPTIDVMVVDVVLPGENGPDVAQRCMKHQSESRVIYMSGYPDDILQSRGVDPATPFLRKPFLPQALLNAVRACLPGTGGEKVTFTIAIANDGHHFNVSLDGEPQSSHASQREAEEAANKLLHEMIPTAPALAFPPIPAGGIFEQPVEAPTA